MKRPGLYLSVLFISIICSAVLVSVAIAGVCKSFYKGEAQETVKVITPASSDIKQASIKL